jgi:glutathione-regulated potassium-efflux system ancillary protein KefG
MARILILFAHPALEKSRVHTTLLKHIRSVPGITFHDLYQVYPDFDIDVKKEQALLLDHDIIIFQHPFYWYSSPAILKQWQDLVLEHHWAYGRDGRMLEGKWIFNAISSGAKIEAYSNEGRNRFTIHQLLTPFDQTAYLCKMKYLPPFIIDGSFKLTQADIEMKAIQYEQLLLALTNGRISEEEWNSAEYLNELCPVSKIIQS